MRTLSAQELRDLLFLQDGVPAEVSLVEVTQTQLEKSIIDAHEGVREAFLRTGFHDYGQQPQGPEWKARHDLVFLTANGAGTSSISLYRPQTKNGDPRLWISRLQALDPQLNGGDVLAIAQDGQTAVGFNLTHVRAFREQVSTYLRRAFLPSTEAAAGPAVAELLDRLRRIASRGPIHTPKVGPTAVGHAVEAALGIQQNSSRDPDYNGIELKSARTGTTNRVSLFAQVPDWDLSACASSATILDRHGYVTQDGTLALRCTVSSLRPNTQGLQLEVDLDRAVLNEVARVGQAPTTPVATWRLSSLTQRLQHKHAETFWIHADEMPSHGGSTFLLRSAVHTTHPNQSAMAALLAAGTISLDHLITRRGGRTREKGPLFKIHPDDLPKLFAVQGEYDLRA
jgi:hypothetical protein